MSLRARMVVAFGLALGLVSLVLLLWLPARLRTVEEGWSERRAYSLAVAVGRSAEPGLDFGDAAFVADRLQVLETAPDARFARVMAEDGSDFGRWGTQGEYEASDALRVVTLPLRGKGGAVGTLQVAFDRTELDAQFADSLVLTCGVLGLMWLVGVGLSYVLGGVVARPLGSLTEVARRFGQEGEAHLELPASQGDFRVDEVRVLSQTFATMVQRITAQMAELELEKRRAVDAEQLAVRASASKSAFLANMSHELRTPLNVIIGYCEMIDESAEEMSPEEIRADLGRAISSARHLLALINDVLDLSKVEAERLDLATEAYDAVAVLEAVVAEARPLAERNGNQVVLNVPVGATPMLGDVTRVHQCLLNLLSNAAKFTRDGTITVNLLMTSEWLRVEVIDTGIGISPEQAARLFQPFVQADPTTTRKYGGTGLGLVLTRRLCELMGGAVELRSTVGVGTTLVMVLPVKHAASAPPTPRPQTPRAA
jgi:signal transduction histidine kinase